VCAAISIAASSSGWYSTMRSTSIPQLPGDHHLRGGVVDAHRQFLGGEAAEDHRVDGPDAGAGEHRHRCFGNHRHVDDDPVASLDTDAPEPAGE
jgi:hypothetical protein